MRKHQHHYQAYRVLQVTGGRRSLLGTASSAAKERNMADLKVDCFHLDYDGEFFGPRPAVISIKHYNNVKAIVDLPVHPLAFHRPDKEGEMSLGKTLLERGRKFEELVNVSHRRYQGMTLRESHRFETMTDVCPPPFTTPFLPYRALVSR